MVLSEDSLEEIHLTRFRKEAKKKYSKAQIILYSFLFHTPSMYSKPSHVSSTLELIPISSPSVYSKASHMSSTLAGEVQYLNESELQHKRGKGLYFLCDDKWSVGHLYWRKEMNVLVALKGIRTNHYMRHWLMRRQRGRCMSLYSQKSHSTQF